MKKFKGVLKSISRNSLALPKGAVFPEQLITITNQNQIIIEEQYRLIYFSERVIELQFKMSLVKICGVNLMIKLMLIDEITLEGEIESIEFNQL